MASRFSYDDYHPTGSVLRISDEKTMQLLDLYHKEQCLWNTRHDSYKDQSSRKRAAEKIATLLEIPNFGPKHVLMKFKNLRNAYSQELKKIARNQQAGISYKPSVFWFNKMDSFIRPHLQKPRMKNLLCNNLDGTEDWTVSAGQFPPYVMTTEIEENSENDSCDSQNRKRKSQSTPTWPKRVHSADSDSDEPKFIEISIPQCPEVGTKPNSDSTIEQIVKDYINDQQKTIIDCFNDLSSGVRALSSRDDDVFDSFGKYVAGLLRTLPHEKALEVQPQIINLITAARLEHLRNKTLQNCSSVIVKIEEC